MKKSLLCILLSVICLPGGSCIFAKTEEGDYIDYNKSIVKCEEQFLFQNSIRKALESYRSVFVEYNKPYAKDCFIALQLACSINDTAIASFFL